jgi:hypothetical protein
MTDDQSTSLTDRVLDPTRSCSECIIISHHVSIPRFSSAQAYSSKEARGITNSPAAIRSSSPASVPSFEMLRAPAAIGPIGQRSYGTAMQGHQQHVRYPQYRGQIKPQHTKFQVGMGSGGGSGSGSGGVGRRAEGGGVADDVCASGLVGRRLQSLPTSLFAPSSSRPVNPLDLPMLWPQPPSSLGSAVPTASGITPPLAAGGAQDTPNRASGTGGFARGAAAEENLLAPTVRSYVTYGRGRFSSRQLAAVSNVRSRDGGMHESFPRRAVGTAGTASAAGAYTSRLQRHDAHHGNNGGGGGGDA